MLSWIREGELNSAFAGRKVGSDLQPLIFFVLWGAQDKLGCCKVMQTEAEQWVGPTMKKKTPVRNKVILHPLIIGKLGLLVITVLLDDII